MHGCNHIFNSYQVAPCFYKEKNEKENSHILINCCKLIDYLECNLKTLECKINNIHCLSEQSIFLCKSVLENLRNRFKENRFKNTQEEIEFYKQIKPKVVSYLIFYAKRLHIESKRYIEGKKRTNNIYKPLMNCNYISTTI